MTAIAAKVGNVRLAHIYLKSGSLDLYRITPALQLSPPLQDRMQLSPMLPKHLLEGSASSQASEALTRLLRKGRDTQVKKKCDNRPILNTENHVPGGGKAKKGVQKDA